MTRRRSAFTLIELLVVIVVIGILAVIAVPRYQGAREKSKASLLVTDLRNLATAEEGYLFEHRTYSANQDSLNYAPTTAVIVTIVEATQTGWSATAEQPTQSAQLCTIFYGNATPIPPAETEGVPACR